MMGAKLGWTAFSPGVALEMDYEEVDIETAETIMKKKTMTAMREKQKMTLRRRMRRRWTPRTRC